MSLVVLDDVASASLRNRLRQRWCQLAGQLLHALGRLLTGGAAHGPGVQVTGPADRPAVGRPLPIACQPVRALIVDYLRERQPAVDHATLRSLSRALAGLFWRDLEVHHPGISSLRLDPAIAAAWKDRIKTNFYKTELELGHCLRLPQEGPCECDLYLTCAKFVTTPQYAPRLRERLCLERKLADQAEERGWEREVDHHQRIADRVHNLLSDIGEPCAPPDDLH